MEKRCKVCGVPMNLLTHNHRLVPVETPIFDKGRLAGFFLTFEEDDDEPRLPFDSG